MTETTKNTLKDLGNILVCYMNKDRETLNILGFDNENDVAEYLETAPYFVRQVLEGKKINDTIWKPNIFYKSIDDTHQYRYIVVYTKDWINYSKRMRENRIKKIGGK